MTTRYAPMRFVGDFADEAQALEDLRRSLVSADESRPPEKRFQAELFRNAKLRDLGGGQRLLAVGESEFLFAPVDGAIEVYGGTPDMVADTEAEAREWIEEAKAMGDHGHWMVFAR